MTISFSLLNVNNIDNFTQQYSDNRCILKVWATIDPSLSVSPLVYLQVFEQVSNITNGQQAFFSKPFGPEGCVELDFGIYGRKSAIGNYSFFVLSSTPVIYTQAIEVGTGLGLKAIFESQVA